MGRLAKKTTILFEPEEYERLKRVARTRRCSVGELIRSTMREQHLPSELSTRLEAVKQLSELALPVADWEELEREIIAGATP